MANFVWDQNISYSCEILFVGRRDGKEVIGLAGGMFVEGAGLVDAVKRYEAQTGKHIPRAAWTDDKWVLEGKYIKEVHI